MHSDIICLLVYLVTTRAFCLRFLTVHDASEIIIIIVIFFALGSEDLRS